MRSWKFLLPLLASSLCFAAQPDRITVPIDSNQVTVLRGSMHGLAQPIYDIGRTDGNKTLYGVSLVFHPSAAQQQDLNNLLSEQQDRSSPNYHKWLTPAQFADRFGMTKADITRVTSWLESQGFTVTAVANSRNQISFDGTVAQIELVFKTEIHDYVVDGETHFANATEPSVPAALAGSVLAIGHLHNFNPKPRAKVQRMAADETDPHYTSYITGNHFVAPGDFATIYDVAPLYTVGFDGTGQKIAIVGQSSVNPSDLSNFRSAAGLSTNPATFILYPSTSISTRCSGDEGESDLDLEWAGAVAKNASIIFVYAGLVGSDTCSNRSNSVWEALQDAIDANIAPVISTSYGYCEPLLPSGFPATVQGWVKQANIQGQTVMAATGDAGAADCDATGAASAKGGIAVDVPASIPEVTGMGGTEFTGDSAGAVSGGNAAADPPYWSGTTGGVDTLSSALVYIPGIAWNDTSTSNGILASGGGASVIFAKPSWQSAAPGSQRDVPDLALNASPIHDPYLFCSEDGANGAIQASCTSGFRTGAGGDFTAVGGTSAAAPTFAGIVALLNQYLGASGLGNINPDLYSFAASNASAFHDITTGSNIVPCTSGTPNCPATAPFQYGFSAAAGYDQVTGLGSVDADVLAVAWGNSRPSTSTSISTSSASVYQGVNVTFTATVSPATATGVVTFSNTNGNTTTSVGTATLSAGTASFTTPALPLGSNSVTAIYNGNLSNNTSTAASPAIVSVLPADFSMQATALNPASIPAGQFSAAKLTVTAVTGSGTINFTPSSCSGLPTGASCSFNPSSVTFGGVGTGSTTLTVYTTANMTVPTGAQTITVTGTTGVGGNTHTVPVTLTITATNQKFTIASTAATYSIVAGGSASVPIAVTGTNGFIVTSTSPTTTALPLNYTCGTVPAGSQCVFSPSSGALVTATAVTLKITTTPPTAKLVFPGHPQHLFYALLLPGLFGIVFAAGSRTRGSRLLTLVVILGFSTLWLGACGGSNSSQNNAGTPAGTYAITVNASTGGANPLTSSFTVNLTVTQ